MTSKPMAILRCCRPNGCFLISGSEQRCVDAAQQLSVISNIAFTEAHQQVIYKVSLAFYAYAAARDRLATATKSLRDAEEVQRAAEDRYKRGIGTVVEVAQTDNPVQKRGLHRFRRKERLRTPIWL